MHSVATANRTPRLRSRRLGLGLTQATRRDATNRGREQRAHRIGTLGQHFRRVPIRYSMLQKYKNIEPLRIKLRPRRDPSSAPNPQPQTVTVGVSPPFVECPLSLASRWLGILVVSCSYFLFISVYHCYFRLVFFISLNRIYYSFLLDCLVCVSFVFASCSCRIVARSSGFTSSTTLRCWRGWRRMTSAGSLAPGTARRNHNDTYYCCC